jgi:hypothetical protein
MLGLVSICRVRNCYFSLGQFMSCRPGYVRSGQVGSDYDMFGKVSSGFVILGQEISG